MAANRTADIKRETKETKIEIEIDLDGTGETSVSTGIGMLDHLIEQIGKHGIIDISLIAKGDLSTDEHHTVEDVGLVLGQAINEALGDRSGIVRMADATVPLDEALATVAVDLNGRGHSVLEVAWTGDRIGELPVDMVSHLMWSIASEGKLTVNARVLSGVNDHHKAEVVAKAFGRALAAASRPEPRRGSAVPSTKGKL